MYIAFAKKRPVLSADKAVFIVVPPHLAFGHKKLTIKINQPNNITTLLALIFYYLILLSKYLYNISQNLLINNVTIIIPTTINIDVGDVASITINANTATTIIVAHIAAFVFILIYLTKCMHHYLAHQR